MHKHLHRHSAFPNKQTICIYLTPVQGPAPPPSVRRCDRPSHCPLVSLRSTSNCQSPTPQSNILISHPLQSQLLRSHRLWTAINQFNPASHHSSILHELIALTFILEDRLFLAYQQSITSQSTHTRNSLSPVIAPISNFYSQQELHPKSVKFSNVSLTSQLFDRTRCQNRPPIFHNKFDPLLNDTANQDEFEECAPFIDNTDTRDVCMGTMEIDNPSISNQPHSASPSILKKTVTWSTDLGIADISAGFISQLKSSQATSNISGDIESEHIDYKSPQDPVISTVKLHQRIRFNHRGVTSDVPAIELFKSFASSLKRADPSLIILPFHASKQHYSSLPTLKHILTMEENKLPQFFQLYHPCQYYSISGYFHISSELTFNDLISMPVDFLYG